MGGFVGTLVGTVFKVSRKATTDLGGPNMLTHTRHTYSCLLCPNWPRPGGPPAVPRAALAPVEALRASGPLDGPAVCIAGSGDGDGGSSIQCRGSPQILSSSYQAIVRPLSSPKHTPNLP